MLRLPRRGISLSVWVICYCLCYNPPTTAAHTKIISKRQINWSHLKGLLCLLYGNVTCNLKHFSMGFVQFLTLPEGGEGRFSTKSSKHGALPLVPPLTHMKSLNPLNRGVGGCSCHWWYLFKTKASAHAEDFSETERFNQRSCNHTEVFTAIRGTEEVAGKARTLPSLKERHSNHASIKAWLKEI